MAKDDDDGLFERLTTVWWGCFILAAFFFGLALLTYWHISGIEERGGGRVNWWVALIYDWAGKLGTVLLFAIPGSIFAILGIVRLIKDDEE